VLCLKALDVWGQRLARTQDAHERNDPVRREELGDRLDSQLVCRQVDGDDRACRARFIVRRQRFNATNLCTFFIDLEFVRVAQAIGDGLEVL
jgi:hypothetical protein